jgi:hypothetical protein
MAIFGITVLNEISWIASVLLLASWLAWYFISYESAPPPPPRYKLVRSVADAGDALRADIMSRKGDPSMFGYYRVIKPLVWESAPSAEGSPNLAYIPDNLRQHCYPADVDITTMDLGRRIEEACKWLNMDFKKEGSIYRWDVRNRCNNEIIDLILEIQIFTDDKNGNLLVYFNIHYTYDNWLAHKIIDQLAKRANLDLSVSINPWLKSAARDDDEYWSQHCSLSS